MTTQAIPVIRAAYLKLFMDEAPRCCENREECLQRANLPSRALHDPGAYVPLGPALSFMNWAARGSDLEHVLLRVGARLRVSDFDPMLAESVQSAPTLEAGLHALFRLADREQSGARYRLVRDGAQASIHITLAGVREAAPRFLGEWLCTMTLLSVIRRFAGAAWAPNAIALPAHHASSEALRRAFPHSRFLSGQTTISIVFPAALLDSAPAGQCPVPAHGEHGKEAVGELVADGPADWDFPTSLREILKSYMAEGYPQITLAARIVGCSVRTLQRRLTQCHVSYTSVVQEARFEAAVKLLVEGTGKVIDTAYSVGYSDPSHFTRAFRRLAGVSPSHYRKLKRMAA